MYKGYHAPMDVYAEVSKLNPTGPAPTICVGKEWYRFSSSFFLPEATEGKGMSIGFIKSGYESPASPHPPRVRPACPTACPPALPHVRLFHVPACPPARLPVCTPPGRRARPISLEKPNR